MRLWPTSATQSRSAWALCEYAWALWAVVSHALQCRLGLCPALAGGCHSTVLVPVSSTASEPAPAGILPGSGVSFPLSAACHLNLPALWACLLKQHVQSLVAGRSLSALLLHLLPPLLRLQIPSCMLQLHLLPVLACCRRLSLTYSWERRVMSMT